MTVRTVPERWEDPKEHFRKIAQAVNDLQRGRTNNVFSVTLTPNETMTSVDVSFARVGNAALIIPQTASAAASATSVYTVVQNGTIEVHHDAAVASDRTFALALFG
jgi:hypothetical protein